MISDEVGVNERGQEGGKKRGLKLLAAHMIARVSKTTLRVYAAYVMIGLRRGAETASDDSLDHGALRIRKLKHHENLSLAPSLLYG